MKPLDIDKGRYLFFNFEQYNVTGGMDEYSFSFDTFVELKDKFEELIGGAEDKVLGTRDTTYQVVDTEYLKWYNFDNLTFLLYMEREYYGETNKTIVWDEDIAKHFPVSATDSLTEAIADEWFIKGSPAEYITMISGVSVEQLTRAKKIDEIGNRTTEQMNAFLDDYTNKVVDKSEESVERVTLESSVMVKMFNGVISSELFRGLPFEGSKELFLELPKEAKNIIRQYNSSLSIMFFFNQYPELLEE